MPGLRRFVFRRVGQENEQVVQPEADMRAVNMAAQEELAAMWREHLANYLPNQAIAPKPPAKPAKPPIRALPNGRLKNVRLGDIVKTYNNNRPLSRDRYEIIDFRPVRAGENYLDKNFYINRAAINKDKKTPMLILARVNGKEREEF